MRGPIVFFRGYVPLGYWREKLAFWKVKCTQGDSPVGISSDATTSMEKDTVEVVVDNSVITWFDERLISALKRACPPELVMTTGKIRDVVGKSM